MIKRIVQFILLSTILLSPLLYLTQVFAASDFEINSDLNITYTDNTDYVSVKDSVEIVVNSKTYFYKSGIIQDFYIPDANPQNKDSERKFKLSNLSIKNMNGVKMGYTVKSESDGLTLEVIIPSQVDDTLPYTLILSYKTHDLINKSGNIINMYVPSLPQDTKFSETGAYGLKTSYTYTAEITLPKTFPAPSYMQPNTMKSTTTSNNIIISIPQQDRIGQTGWLEFGDSQYYKFKIVQIAKKTDNITPTSISNIAPISSTNIYKLALPREYDENGQKVLITSINPKPKSFERDSEGNLIATFEVSANEDTQITIEGLISLKSRQMNIPDSNLSDYKNNISTLPDLTTYTQPDKYWESNDPMITKIGQDLLSNSSTILSLIKADYKYVVDKFTYSDTKLNDGNIRLGAKEALITGQATCMEYADTLIAILRSQGIPSRSAIGYGNDPTGIENNISNTQLVKQTVGHEWVQAWIPNYGWLSIDPTWGESQREYIGGDLDHILWYTVGNNEQNIADTTIYSADKVNIANDKSDEVYLQALTSSEYTSQNTNGQDANELISEYNSKTSPLDLYIKTTLMGRIIIYLLPIISVVIFSSIISAIIFKIIRRKNKGGKGQQPL